MPLNRATFEWADIDTLLDSVHTLFDEDTVMTQVLRDKDGNFEKLRIHQISTGAVIDPNAVATYDSAPTASTFEDNAGLRWRKTAATTWVNTEA